jgi:4-amino-4-deoxy-L-arabinose transferase-like glycosyltransferase
MPARTGAPTNGWRLRANGSSWPGNSQIKYLLLLLVAVIYLWRLGDAPLYLAPDEVIIANDAYAVATTGRALNGTSFPLYFQAGNSWFMPVIYYAMALALQVLPLAEWSIRVPIVLLGLLSIALTYVVGCRLTGPLHNPAEAGRLRQGFGAQGHHGLIAAFVLACSPAFFILSRYGLDYTAPLPFVLGWLVCLSIALDRPHARRWLAGAGVCLGVGWYAYISSMVMMPVYVVMTLAVLVARKRDWRDVAAFLAGFTLPVAFFVIWLIQHPQAIEATARRYTFEATSDTRTRSLLQLFDAGAMVSRYANFFRIDFLFRLGDTYLPFSTRSAGVFVGAAGVLIAAGIYAAAVTYRHAMTMVVLFGFLLSPLAASVLRDEGAIRRATSMLVFGALLAGLGAAQLRRIAIVPFFKPVAMAVAGVGLLAGLAVMTRTAMFQGRISETASRVIVIAIVALIVARLSTRYRHGALIVAPILLVMAWQFAVFLRSYHGEYMTRVAVWLQGNTRGAMERLVAESDARPQAPVYLATLRSGGGHWDQRNLYIPPYWRFYTTKLGRQDLHQRAVILPIDDNLQELPKGSVVMAGAEDPNVLRLIANGAQRVADIPEVAGDPYYTIIVR